MYKKTGRSKVLVAKTLFSTNSYVRQLPSWAKNVLLWNITKFWETDYECLMDSISDDKFIELIYPNYGTGR